MEYCEQYKSPIRDKQSTGNIGWVAFKYFVYDQMILGNIRKIKMIPNDLSLLLQIVDSLQHTG